MLIIRKFSFLVDIRVAIMSRSVFFNVYVKCFIVNVNCGSVFRVAVNDNV